MAVIYKKETKRKAGQRAGMTREKIIEAAVKLWEAAGPEGFTIRKLAARLKVVPTTIRAHVKGGAAELRREIARRVLADLTPPISQTSARTTICRSSSVWCWRPSASTHDWPGLPFSN